MIKVYMLHAGPMDADLLDGRRTSLYFFVLDIFSKIPCGNRRTSDYVSVASEIVAHSWVDLDMGLEIVQYFLWW